MRLISSTLLLSTVLSLSSPVLSTTSTDPSNTSNTAAAATPEHSALVARANTLLSTGQFADAARVYSEALEHSPNDYVLYFKRATAYLSSNRNSPALDDFDTVLKLTDGSFDKALIAKARIYTKEGRWQEGREALTVYTKKVQGNKEAQELMFAVSDGEIANKKAIKAHKNGKWDECISASTTALQSAPYAASLRQMRADCALAAGDIEQAVADLTRLTHLGTANTALLLRVSALSYFLSPTSEQGLKTLKQCLHFDPDSKPCKAAHRLLKALDKQFDQLEKAGQIEGQVIKIITPDEKGLAAKFDKALEDILKSLDGPLPAHIQPKKQSPRRLQIWRAACKAYVQSNDIRKAEKWCSEVLRMDAENEDGLVGAGEVALKNEEWEEAVRFFDRAFNASGKQNHDILQRLQKAQRLLKQAKKKDYYKVLGVSRDADTKMIKKAFRKKAIESHPDKGGSESKMASVNEAYEVLSNPELRQRYDNGDDPNDPESQQGGHPFHGSPFQFFQQQGSPFGQGGGAHFRQGGGGQQFNFRFN